MIIRDVDNNGYQFRTILVDDLNPEDVAMVQALKARSGETSEVVLNRIYASRRDAMTEVLRESGVLDLLDAREKQVVATHATHAVQNWGDPPATLADAQARASDMARRCGESFDAFLRRPTSRVLNALMAIAAHNDASALARRIHKDYTVGYGHKSIADCGTTTLIIEGVSMLAAKAIENHPLFAGQETSTRMVDMSKVRIVDPVGSPESKAELDKWMAFYTSSWEATAEDVRQRHPRREGENQKAYEAAVKSRTFDILRAWIPAGATTHVSVTMNLRQFGDHISNLLRHPLAEVRTVAQCMQTMLCERYPSSGSFGGTAGVSGVGLDDKQAERDAWSTRCTARGLGVDYQPARLMPELLDDGYDDTLQSLDLEFECDASLLLSERPRGCLLPHWMADLGQISCQFDLDFGSFRDIQRHRNGVCRMSLLTTGRGFESWYITELPAHLREQACEMVREAEVRRTLRSCSLVENQYYLPMGFKVPVSVTYGLPAFVYVVELRSTPQVHPTLRRAVLDHMVKPFRKHHPEVRLYADDTPDTWSLRRGEQTIERVEKG